jgi:hypothetical protein
MPIREGRESGSRYAIAIRFGQHGGHAKSLTRCARRVGGVSRPHYAEDCSS